MAITYPNPAISSPERPMVDFDIRSVPLQATATTRALATVDINLQGDNPIIAAPPAGQRIAIVGLRIQSVTGISTTCILKSGIVEFAKLLTDNNTRGLSEVYVAPHELRLGDGEAFEINLSDAQAHQVSVHYLLESTVTGMPI